METKNISWKEKIIDLAKESEKILDNKDDKRIPWWNDEFKTHSKNLWIPSFEKSPFTFEEEITAEKHVEHKNKAWFSIKKQCFEEEKEKSFSLTSKIKNEANLKIKIITKKIRVFPTKEERKILNDYFNEFRCSYNTVLGVIKVMEKEDKTTYDSLFSKKAISYSSLRDEINKYEHIKDDVEKTFVKTGKNTFPFPKGTISCHARICRGAIKLYTQNINSAKTNLSNGNVSHYELRPKKKKEWTEECLFEDKSYPAFLKKLKGRYSEKKKKFSSQEMLKNHKKGLIVFHNKKINQYYLLIPVDVPIQPKETIVEKQEIISLDTGVRTFQTGYSPNGEIVEIGKDDYLKISLLLEKTDIMQKKLNRTKKKKWRIRRLKLFCRIKNMISDLHWKTIKFLVSSYKTIIIPDFRIGGMVKSLRLPKKTKRMLYMYSYFAFKQRLLYKASLEEVKVFVVDESFTSKTCGRCGWQHHSLGGNKTFRCKECSLEIDRDFNGARNILLKHLSQVDAQQP